MKISPVVMPFQAMLFIFISLLCSTVTLRAASLFDSATMRVDSDGTFTIYDLTFGVVLYDATYVGDKQTNVKADGGYPKISSMHWGIQGVWSPKAGAPFAFQESIAHDGNTSYKVKFHLKSLNAANLTVPLIIACQTLLPADTYAQKTLAVDDQDLNLALEPVVNFEGCGV